jgi:hypothetical protein
MARVKTRSESLSVKLALAQRLVTLRTDLYGTRGAPAMARQLNLSPRTWYNYEKGCTLPGETVLRIIETFAIEPRWLLSNDPRKG